MDHVLRREYALRDNINASLICFKFDNIYDLFKGNFIVENLRVLAEFLRLYLGMVKDVFDEEVKNLLTGHLDIIDLALAAINSDKLFFKFA